MKWSIGRKLSLGFGSLGAMLAVAVGVVWWQLGSVREVQTHLSGVSLPALESVAASRVGAARASAAMRGLLLQGDDPDVARVFKAEREEALKSLHDGRKGLEAAGADAGLASIRDDVQKLAAAVTALEGAHADMLRTMHTPDDHPARQKFMAEGVAAASETVAELTKLMDAEMARPVSAESRQRLRQLADARAATVRTRDAATRALLSGAKADVAQFEETSAAMTAAVATVTAPGGQTGQPDAALAAISQAAGRFVASAREAAAARQTDGWSKSLQVQAERAAPAARQIGEVLDRLSGTLTEGVEGEGAAALGAIRTSINTLLVLAAAVAVVSVFTTLTLARGLTGSITAVSRRAESVARGELFHPPLQPTTSDEVADLVSSVNAMSASLRELVSGLRTTSQGVAAAATQIAASAQETAGSMSQQTSQVQQVSAAVEEMSASVSEVATKAGEVSTSATQAGETASSGGAVVARSVNDMKEIAESVTGSAALISELGKRGEQIKAIVQVINDIADQTNLLALNAAIEAARAGEHGRGFAVVADEVRKLADRTTQATDEIAGSITAIGEQTGRAVQQIQAVHERVTKGVENASEAGRSLEEIKSGTGAVAGMVQSIAAAAREQAAAAEEISRTIQGVSAATREATAAADQSAKAATDLSGRAEELDALVRRFRTEMSAR
jgi:methyl-accepting chemotaxis protein